MKIISRIVPTIIVFFILLQGVVDAAEESTLQNGSFEHVEDGSPAGWTRDQWSQEDGATRLTVETGEAHSGSYAVGIENVQANDASWTQTVPVQPDSYYRISGWVKAIGIGKDGAGANLSILGFYDAFPEAKNTGGQWVLLEFYGKTLPEQTDMQVAARLGTYGRNNTGKAYFDDIQVERIASVPAGVPILPLGTQQTASPKGNSASAPASDSSPHASALPLFAFSVLFSLIFALLYRRTQRDNPPMLRTERRTNRLVLILLMLAFVIRVWIASSPYGYTVDVNTFMAWAERVNQVGFSGFYQDGVFADYSPGYIYVLYLLGSIRRLFDWGFDSNAAQLLFKSPAMLADLFTAIYIYRIGKTKLGTGAAAGLSLLYALNPTAILNSAVWGQVDAFFTLFLLLAVVSAAEHRIERSGIWFAVAVLIKPQAFIFTPVLLLACFSIRSWRRITASILYGAAVFLLATAPFFLTNGGLAGVFKLYKTTLASYPYASVNGYNAMALFGKNWVSLDQYPFGEAWGSLAIIFAVIAAAVYFIWSRKNHRTGYEYIAVALIAIVFVLGTKMHERYLFPALALCLLSYIRLRDRRLLHIYLGFSLTQFINVGYVYLNSRVGNYHLRMDGIVVLCSLAVCVLLIYLLYIGFDIFYRQRICKIQADSEDERQIRDRQLLSELAEESAPKRLSIKRKDWIILAVVTLLYSAVALSQLGSHKDPETYWKPAADGEHFVVDFGEVKTLERVNSYAGAGSGQMEFEYSADMSHWTKLEEKDSSAGSVFAWKIRELNAEARYVRLTVLKAGFTLHELAFYELDNTVPLAIQHIDRENAAGNLENLFDEPSSSYYASSYMNSTYFDEIYHVRTAYEHLHGIEPYENTHPPLGKLLIAIGIQLFGMNPFGWRIVGALFGVAMIPALYLFALRLFRRTEYAAISAILLAVDFMHFTQSRISVVDVYAVFFGLLMFYYMYRYTVTDVVNEYRKSLLLLLASGLFFGLGLATKWNVAYGGVGLATIFGLTWYRRYRQYVAAKRWLRSGKDRSGEWFETGQRLVRVFPRYVRWTFVWCIVFFLLVPMLIYGLVYLAVPSVNDGGYSLEKLWAYQKHMYHYHSTLVATHPFSSNWWEWPFIKRPVWYFTSGVQDGRVSTIAAFGNPFIWWAGAAAIAGSLWLTIRQRQTSYYVIWIAYFSLLVPWILVSRLTFIYHYFPMVPFMILAITYILKWAEEKIPSLKPLKYIYTGLSGLLFLMFYPVLSGMTVSQNYITHWLRWFASWIF